MSTGVIVLAAGSSSRMGRSKQLLVIEGEPLLLHTARVALDSKVNPVVVVLGAREQEHVDIIKHLPVEIVTNAEWQKGMGGSLKTGLRHLKKIIPSTDAVIILACDQPYVTSQYLQKMIERHTTSGKSIIASWYADSPGIPVLFTAKHFDDLLQLDDSQGAKKIIQQYADDVEKLDFPLGIIDLDTLEDYNTFIKK